MIEDDFKALRELIKEIEAGKTPNASKRLWELAEAVCASQEGKELDLEKWAEQLASDIVEAED